MAIGDMHESREVVHEWQDALFEFRLMWDHAQHRYFVERKSGGPDLMGNYHWKQFGLDINDTDPAYFAISALLGDYDHFE